MEHAVILAGGSGMRLWPMSRRRRPKQFLPLVQGRSLLELALDRLAGGFPPQRTWIVTSADLAGLVREIAADLPPENVIAEPAPRDTANAIGLTCLLLADRDPDARVGFFTADHVIRPADRFLAAVRDAFAFLDRQGDALVTFGVLPGWPHTGLGYIHRGRALADRFHAVARFVEKPDRPTAEQYLASGQYYWNSGMFLWRARSAIDALARFRPQHVAALRRAADAFSGGDAAALAEAYLDLPRISIDYALMEPASTCPDCSLVVRELDCQWVDLGSWSVLAEVNPVDGAGNLRVGRSADAIVAADAAGNIVVNDAVGHLVAAMGIEDLVVVHTDDVTLVVPRARAQDIKALLDEVRSRFGDRYE